MNYQNEFPYSMGNCPTQGNLCRKNAWYCKFIKPFFSFVVSVLLALSMSHLCEKYSSNNSFQMIQTEMSTLRNNLDLLSNEVRDLMESRDELKGKLKELVCIIPKLSDAILQLRNEVSEGLEVQTKKLLEAVSPEKLKNIVKSELEIYDADKTGRIDFALETAGGTILSTRTTETYTAGAPVLKILGIPICQQQNTPRAIIQASVLPGECWAIKGSQGSVVIQLFGYVLVSGVSLEHISPTISPTGETSTAPREFSLWGLYDVEDKNGYLLGRFTYENSGPPLQYFEVERKPELSYRIVELKIHSNSGHRNYTCIYRIRIHGTLTSYQEAIT